MQDTAPTHPNDPRLLQLAPADNVAATTTVIEAGQPVMIAGKQFIVADRIPTGHKVALAPIEVGEKILKYGAPIGSATARIQPGEYVHTHNVKSDYLPTYTSQGSSPL